MRVLIPQRGSAVARSRSTGSLDLRSESILRAVIDEYVTTALPVGSQSLVERYGLGGSGATVRNLLAALEPGGLLTHPHTSAGRIPTDAGYRHYVEAVPIGGRGREHQPRAMARYFARGPLDP